MKPKLIRVQRVTSGFRWRWWVAEHWESCTTPNRTSNSDSSAEEISRNNIRPSAKDNARGDSQEAFSHDALRMGALSHSERQCSTASSRTYVSILFYSYLQTDSKLRTAHGFPRTTGHLRNLFKCLKITVIVTLSFLYYYIKRS